MEGTAVFLCSTFQYVALAFVYSKGPPYRKPLKDNLFFMISLIVLTLLNIMITVIPFDAFNYLLRVILYFKFFILIILNNVLSFFFKDEKLGS